MKCLVTIRVLGAMMDSLLVRIFKRIFLKQSDSSGSLVRRSDALHLLQKLRPRADDGAFWIYALRVGMHGSTRGWMGGII